MATLLRCRDLDKRFGGIVALDGFDVTIPAGRITGLIGPNGAGKTTLFNVVTGVIVPDGGTVHFDGRDITGELPHAVCHAGIARTFQTPRPIESLTVAENLRVARRFGRADGDGPGLDRVLELVGLADRRSTSAADLQMVDGKYVDLGRALMTAPRLVLLDEIMAGLTPSETDEMVERLRRLHRTFDVDFLVVEHDLRAIRAVSDAVVAMNEGRFIAEGPAEDVLADDRVRQAYVGA